MHEREYRQDFSGRNNQGSGPIIDYERRMRSEGAEYSESGTNLSIEQLEREDELLYRRFGSSSENGISEVAQASEPENLTPEDEAQINQVFQAGIPTALVGTYGTILGTKVIWQSFAKVIVQRFGVVAAQALGLSAADGLLPVGEAIALGLLAYTAIQIARNWDELWAEANDLLDQQFLESYVPAPNSLPGFPDAKEVRGKTPKQGGGSGKRKRWKDSKKKIYEWDYQHGKVERYNKRGKHEGEFDPETGEQTKPAEKTRSVEP